MPLAKSPMTVQTGGEGRYRYRNVKENGSALMTLFLLSAFSASRIQIPAAFSQHVCYSTIVEIGFSFVKRILLK